MSCITVTTSKGISIRYAKYILYNSYPTNV